QSEHLAAALRERLRSADRLLLVRADRGRDLLQKELSTVCQVDQVAAYVQAEASLAESPALDQLRRGEIDFVTLTSSNIARAFFRSLVEICRVRLQSQHTRLVSLSPITSMDIIRAGFPIAGEARRATAEGLVEALVDLSKR